MQLVKVFTVSEKTGSETTSGWEKVLGSTRFRQMREKEDFLGKGVDSLLRHLEKPLNEEGLGNTNYLQVLTVEQSVLVSLSR